MAASPKAGLIAGWRIWCVTSWPNNVLGLLKSF